MPAVMRDQTSNLVAQRPVINSSQVASALLRVERLKVGPLPPLSFEVANGECLSVEGPSGAGKTRLLRAIADLDPAPGHIFADGAERREVPGHRWRKLVRYSGAEPQWWTASVREGLPDDEASTQRIQRMMTGLGLAPALLDMPIAHLSTGERQRFALIRSLADEPGVLLLDEPTASLDAASAALVEELIRYQLLAGRAVVLVSHDRGLAARLAHQRLQLAPPPAVRTGASP